MVRCANGNDHRYVPEPFDVVLPHTCSIVTMNVDPARAYRNANAPLPIDGFVVVAVHDGVYGVQGPPNDKKLSRMAEFITAAVTTSPTTHVRGVVQAIAYAEPATAMCTTNQAKNTPLVMIHAVRPR